MITDERKRQLDQEYPGKFIAMMGAEGIKELLKKVDVEFLSEDIRAKMKTETSQQKKLKFAKRLRVVESFRKSGNKPEWMILDVIPVIPPELRPLVPLDGGRFATSDLNDLYRRVINRNNRLKKLIELHAPDVIVRNEKRMLQEAVDALFDNGRRGRVLRGANNRPLKSLSDTLKGKQGRFRQNLLGKRVDYSGRSVIVVGPELKLNQCGLPKKMALELFKPFIYHRLEQRGHCTTIKQAKELVEQQDPVVWDILEEVIKDHPILLNRAPTLHRLGIQAFEPVLVEGKAIKIHPLVCTAFNADFDGDQMAVHIPLSPEAQIEASTLMLSSNNILSPAHGGPIAVPTQDMVLGCYYLTKARPGTKGEGRTFASVEDVLIALEMGEVETLTPIKLRYTGKVIDLVHAFDNQNMLHTEPIEFVKQYMETTVGRVILNDQLPQDMPFINGLLKKKGLAQLVQYCYLKFGLVVTVQMLDQVKALGFLYATRAGISIGIDDMVVPSEKAGLVREAEKEVVAVENQYQDGAITHGERYNKIIEIWSKVTEKVSDEMFQAMEEDDRTGRYLNPIYIMADSGARGSKQQIRQLSGMRGLMAKPSGEIIETPITANFREGLNVLQYFISTHGARKGSGRYRFEDGRFRLPDAPPGGRLAGRDHRRNRLRHHRRHLRGAHHRIRRNHRAVARPHRGPRGARRPEGLRRQRHRGREPGNHRRPGRGHSGCRYRARQDPLGAHLRIEARRVRDVLRPQPGLRTAGRARRSGGRHRRAVHRRARHAAHHAYVPHRRNGFPNFASNPRRTPSPTVSPATSACRSVRSKTGELIAMNRNGIMAVVDDKGREKERYQMVYGAKILVEDGGPVKANQILLEWDPYTFSILTEVTGTVHFKDLLEGMTMQEQLDEVTGMSQLVVIDSPDEKRQPTVIVRPDTALGSKSEAKKYLMPTHAHLMVRDGEEVHAGDVLAKIPRETTKTKDITGGLPRVVELFEARKPRETAIMAEINGAVKYGEVTKGQRKIYVVGDDGEQREYSLPRGVHINVQEGERVKAGEPLMDGPRNPHDILDVLGEKELQKYLVNEIQEVYRLQGVNINDKHLEVVVRQMMRWVKVEDIGDTEFLPEEVVDKFRFRADQPADHRSPAAVRRRAGPCCWASPRRRFPPIRSSPRPPSRRPPACSPKPPSTARWTTCAA